MEHGFVALGIDFEHDAEICGATLGSGAVEIARGIAGQTGAQRQRAVATTGEVVQHGLLTVGVDFEHRPQTITAAGVCSSV